VIEPLIVAWKARHPSVTGNQGRYKMRGIINALLYQNRAGCQWELLPHGLPQKARLSPPRATRTREPRPGPGA
jgi:transposase